MAERSAMINQRVDILLATYNGAAYLSEQIESILSQTEGNWRLLISDDGSTDGTEKLVESYATRYPDKIHRVFSERHFGNARSHFLWMAQQSDAAYLFFCDQDDVWYKDKIHRMMSVMMESEKQYGADTPLLVFSDQTVADKELQTISPSLIEYQHHSVTRFDYRALLMQNVVTGGAMVINRALATLAAQCRNHRAVIMHDWWYAIVAARFGHIVHVPVPLSAYRQHGHNAVGAKKVRSLKYFLRRIFRMEEVRQGIIAKKQQAIVFSHVYADLLNDEDRAFLDAYCKRRSGLAFYRQHRHLIYGRFRYLSACVFG